MNEPKPGTRPLLSKRNLVIGIIVGIACGIGAVLNIFIRDRWLSDASMAIRVLASFFVTASLIGLGLLIHRWIESRRGGS
jgi:hypothetical protein